jgi:hypothetical protein
MVMAGANINEMIFLKTPTHNIHWATLYGSEIQQTHYITQLLLAGGCRQEEIVSVIFAKPEQKLKKISSIIIERRVCSQRALTEEKCTIIFATAQALHQFVSYYKNIAVWQEHPKIQIGFNDTPYTGSTAVMAEQREYMGLEQFEKEFPIDYTDSNTNNEVQTKLFASKTGSSNQISMTESQKCHAAINVLKRARSVMSTHMFKPIQDAVIFELGLTTKRAREDNTFEYFNTGSSGVSEYGESLDTTGKSEETLGMTQKTDMEVVDRH